MKAHITKEIAEYLQGYKSTTNNRMEIKGTIEALRNTPESARVLLYSDSSYVINTVSKGWQKKANTDLWNELDAVMSTRQVTVMWLKGHAGDVYNEQCDSLTTKAYSNYDELIEDTGYTGQ